MNALVARRRSITAIPRGYGRYFGEGMYVMAFSNHIWPKDRTMREAGQLAGIVRFAEWEAREALYASK